MTDRLILVLDEGTTSTRAILFDARGQQVGAAQADLTQNYPQAGWAEHDPQEIWDKTLACAQEVVTKADAAHLIAGIGITNQRETVVAWDLFTGKPLAQAIVWHDRRTADYCADLKARGHEEMVRAKTGLLLDPYFSASKMRWMLENEPAVAQAAEGGSLAFGTVESWLIFNLSGSHVTDASNASRTLLMALDGADWDEKLCALFGIPINALPKIVDNVGDIAVLRPELLGLALNVTGMAGDQQAATIGQGCLSPGQTKATYGTGAFVLANMGREIPRSHNRMLGTVLHQIGGVRQYALEGSVFVAGSLIKYLRDTLGLIATAAESEELARSIDDSGGVVVVPALSGLGAPHWRPNARGAIAGLSFHTGKAQIVRAALEAMAHQTRDLAQAFSDDGARWTGLKIDGGMAANSWMAQDIADLLDLPVARPDNVETTALGAAMLAAVGCGMYGSLDQAAQAMIGAADEFTPQMDQPARQVRLDNWAQAITKL